MIFAEVMERVQVSAAPGGAVVRSQPTQLTEAFLPSVAVSVTCAP